MAQMVSGAQSFVGAVKQSTMYFAKMAGLIGAVGMMLGGAVVFGIDRLANRVMERRREMMASGVQSFEAYRSGQIGASGLTADPKSAITNLGRMLAGDPAMMVNRSILGIPGNERRPTEQVMADMLERVVPRLARIQRQHPGMLLNDPLAQAFEAIKRAGSALTYARAKPAEIADEIKRLYRPLR
jgi:hypothetical protein